MKVYPPMGLDFFLQVTDNGGGGGLRAFSEVCSWTIFSMHCGVHVNELQT